MPLLTHWQAVVVQLRCDRVEGRASVVAEAEDLCWRVLPRLKMW